MIGPTLVNFIVECIPREHHQHAVPASIAGPSPISQAPADKRPSNSSYRQHNRTPSFTMAEDLAPKFAPFLGMVRRSLLHDELSTQLLLLHVLIHEQGGVASAMVFGCTCRKIRTLHAVTNKHTQVSEQPTAPPKLASVSQASVPSDRI